jgi:hypothetical protein
MSSSRDGYSNVSQIFSSPLPAHQRKPARSTGWPRCRFQARARATTPGQFLVLYARNEILVTNDSGPAHFASMTPIHVVTLFGPETPALFAARSPNASVLCAGIACSPCVNAYNNRQTVCRDNLCMQAITVEQVFERVTGLYEARLSARPRASTLRAADAPRP